MRLVRFEREVQTRSLMSMSRPDSGILPIHAKDSYVGGVLIHVWKRPMSAERWDERPWGEEK